MLKKSSLKKRPLIALGILLLFIIVAYSTIYYYRDLVFGPPVLFWEDDYIQVNLYPSQYKSAVVFTVDDVTKLTDPKKVIAIADVLEKYGFKGVFFVIPQYKGRYRLTTDDSITQALLKISDGGHEIAQHGLTHSLPRKKPKIVNQAREFTDLPYGEQKRRVFVGKKILKEAGFMINGFRAPAFSADYNTLDVLEHLDFLYGSNAGLYPPP